MMSIELNEFMPFMIAGLTVLVMGCLLLIAYVLYKVRRVHIMTYEVRDEVQKISSKHLIDLSQNLQELDLLAFELEMKRPLPKMRGWVASPDVLLVLARHARKARPQVIVECGSGVSTVVLARCCQLNGSGHVYSLENDPEFADETRDLLSDYSLSSCATVLDAPLRTHEIDGKPYLWYSHECLREDLEIDMLFVDGPPGPLGPQIRYSAGPLLFQQLNPDAVVFVDDAAREDETLMVKRWMSEVTGLTRRDLVNEKGCVVLTRRVEG